MLILAFDTTSEVGGVGVFRDHECLACVANDGPANRYSVSLFYMVDQAIEEAKVRQGVPARGLADVGLIAVATGPGSFTGIRVGLAAAQGWAKAFGLPVCGVSVLQALVEAAQTRTDWAAPVLDARRGEFFVGLFQRVVGATLVVAPGRPQEPTLNAVKGPPLQEDQPSYVPVGEGWLLRPEELNPFLTRHLPEGAGATCLVRANDRAALALCENLSSSFQWQAVTGTLVESVARLGLRDYRAGKQQGAGDLDAYYIRRSDAELYWDSKIENRNSKTDNGKPKMEAGKSKFEIRKSKFEDRGSKLPEF
jgi:tRNA threonylcarbamoyladenosine biosynthesis protein TsaB